MDLYEYQAKELFAAHGVPVLPGRTVDDADDAAAAAAESSARRSSSRPRSRPVAAARRAA